jgi:hypothetical protein
VENKWLTNYDGALDTKKVEMKVVGGVSEIVKLFAKLYGFLLVVFQ